MFRRISKFALVAALAATLVACGGPSESDMKAAIDKQMAAEEQGFSAIAGSKAAAAMKDLVPQIKSLKKIGCKEDGENAYRCDVELEVVQSGHAGKGTNNLRFVKASDGWSVQK